ncbi:EtfB1: electron transfer flavoprotein, subunit beta [Desulfosarcina variabilis str. Montpellier]|uniref:electron transfer flavoprotein subunit beta/FixA family protein n=1 Tax=Desulfosarcina variabilis TaxID=2300 RepID=UPI003AFB2EA2
MNICVCVKQVEETYARTGRDPEQHFIDPKDRIVRINPFDEAAMALAVSAARGITDARIIVLTLGPILAEEELYRILAMGGEELYHLDPGPVPGGVAALDSWSKAQLLAKAMRSLEADLILCGSASIDRQNGLVPAYLAHQLNLPFVSSIVDLTFPDGTGRARTTKSAGKGRREIIDCQVPAVLSVDLNSAAPPTPSFAARQQARRQGMTRMLVDAALLKPKTRLVQTRPARPRPIAAAAPDSSLPAFDRVRQLLAGSKIQKTGKLVTGSPESQVEEILNLLAELEVLNP